MRPSRRLGAHLAVGLAASAVLLGAFVELAWRVVRTRGRGAADLELASALHAHAQGAPGLVRVARVVTELGASWCLSLVGLSLAAVLARAGHRARAIVVASGTLGAGLLDALLKSLFRRPRPAFPDPFVAYRTWSFPSGHALWSLVVYGLVAHALALSLRRRWQRAGVLAGAAALVLAIGFTRMYLGAHYASDVLGGYAAGGVWLAVCVTGLESLRRRAPT